MADFSSRNTKKTVNATNEPEFEGAAETSEETTGEGFGVGTKYAAVLNERPNKSTRNAGPTRPSANTGKVPVVNKQARKTGRV